MPIAGYAEYKSRDYCKDIKCPIQLLLDSKKAGSKEYEEIKQSCIKNCRHTAREFHRWLNELGYLIVRPE